MRKEKKMNTGTKLRTILAIATSLNTALMATDLTGFSNATVDAVYRWASIVLNFIIVALVTYKNNDYTKIAAEHTGRMRLEKEQSRGITDGEDFLTELDDEEDEDADPEDDEDLIEEADDEL